MSDPGTFAAGTRYLLYLPRLLASAPGRLRSDRVEEIEGTVVLADVSGFTALSEELAKAGRRGAEQVTGIVNGAFAELLAIARVEGGDLISFGGDSLLLLFSGPDHARRAATACYEMRAALDDYQAAESPVALAMSMGAASGPITAVVAGSQFRQLMLVGSTVDRMLDLEGLAAPGEILVSEATAVSLEPGVVGEARDGGVVMVGEPRPSEVDPLSDDAEPVPADLAAYIPPALQDELVLSGAHGEHRPAVIGFIRAQGVDGLSQAGGAAAVRDALSELLDTTSSAAGDFEVTLLASDVSRDGIKLILAAGVPRAAPEVEERMLRAVRRVVEAPLDLSLHVGVAAGDVFAGDLGASFRRGYTVMGDTVNLAARLAGQASRGKVITTWRVLDRSRTQFVIRQLPPVALKGKTMPISAVELGPMTAVEEPEMAPGRRMVGRTAELGTLLESTDEVRAGRGAVIEVLGPPGMGKTRLLLELRVRTAQVPMMIIECEEYEAQTPYRASRLLLRHLTNLKEVRSAAEAGERLVTLVETEIPHLSPWLPLLAIPFEANVDETPEVRSLDPRFRLPKLFEVVGDLLEHLMPSPATVAFDNTQWMDPASRELLSAVMLRHVHSPWLWIWAHRAEKSELGDALGGSSVELGPLTEDDAHRLVAEIAPDRSPLEMEEAVERGAGNPLFLIELASTPPGTPVTQTVERLLAARVDRLGARERRLLREAAVLGHQFDLDVLVEAVGTETSAIDDPAIWGHLDEFLEIGSGGRIRFRQPLVRDVAYEGLPFRRREELHGVVGDTIERRARHRARREAAVLSLHFEAAKRFDKAWEYAVVGARRAAERYANREAVALFERALRVAEKIDGLDRDERAAAAEQLGDVADLAGDFQRAWSAYETAEHTGSGERRADLLRKQALLREKGGDYDEAIELLELALDLPADQTESHAEAMVGMAGIRYRQGNYMDSADWCERALALAKSEASPTVAHARYLLSLNQTHLGDSRRSDNARSALEIYERLGDWAAVGKVLNNLGIDAYYGGRWSEAADLYTKSREASAKAGDVVMTATQDNNLAEILSDQGRLDEAEQLFRRAEVTWRSAHYEVGIALITSNLGRLTLRQGKPGPAREMLDSARERFAAMGADAFVAETRIRLLEVLVQEGRADEAQEESEELLRSLADTPGAAVQLATLWRLRGHVLTQLGSIPEAVAAFREAQARAKAIDAPYEEGLAARALGQLGDATAATDGERILTALAAGDAPDLPLR
jgi:class 3 adenylate cyclase/tetratricopeptide (TPR) repeat protein